MVRGSGPDPYLTLVFSGFQIFFVFTYCRTGKISVFKDKKLLEVNQGFFEFFCLSMERSGFIQTITDLDPGGL
jgi:hypothetical protein